jgi:hypothetical protein
MGMILIWRGKNRDAFFAEVSLTQLLERARKGCSVSARPIALGH